MTLSYGNPVKQIRIIISLGYSPLPQEGIGDMPCYDNMKELATSKNRTWDNV